MKEPPGQKVGGFFVEQSRCEFLQRGQAGKWPPRRGPDPHLSKAFSSALTLRAVSPRQPVALLRK